MPSLPGISPLFALLDAERAHTYSLVLASTGIPHTIDYVGARWQIHVANELRQQAQEAVALYLLENPAQAKPAVHPDHTAVRTYSAVFAALLLIAIHFAIGPDPYRQAFIASFGADARKIMDGQLYRCVTALMLHANSFHLLGNIAGTLLFGTYAAILYGWGVGWLLILLTGLQGNFLTAWWYGHSHVSIGASTAVFGALGLCAALTFWRQRNDQAGHWRPWLPLAAALALLGWLGTAPQADFLAHLLGFGSGLFYGSLYEKSIGRVLSWPFQAAGLVLLAVVVSGSWVWGLFYSG